MFTRDGRLRILDFGLAKLQEDSSPGENSSTGIEEPTMTFSPDLTEPGTVLGGPPATPEDAIDALEQAVAGGWRHKEWIEHDSDLDPLRDHPRYKALLASM